MRTTHISRDAYATQNSYCGKIGRCADCRATVLLDDEQFCEECARLRDEDLGMSLKAMTKKKP